MALQGIDISGWQEGIDLSQVPCDFIISKATQGVSYVSQDCARQVEQAFALGKKVGVYHYISGGGARKEADYFLDNCAGWDNRVIWCLDWESNENAVWGDLRYLETMIKRMISRTGKPPVIYASLSDFPWDLANAYNCGTWVAQYPDNNPTGYVENPWNEGAYQCAIRQYSSTGRLPGWDGSLDLNKFYGDHAAWDAYVTGGKVVDPQPTPPTVTDKDIETLANEVLHGQWGNGDDRVNRLTQAGYDAAAVQARVNEMLAPASRSIDELAGQVLRGEWGNGNDRVNRLSQAGYDAAAVQTRVNEILGAGKTEDVIVNEVIRGEWGNGLDRVNRLIAAGYDPKAIQDKVNHKLFGAKSLEEIAWEVIRGEWGNMPEREYRLRASGYNFDEVQALVNQLWQG